MATMFATNPDAAYAKYVDDGFFVEPDLLTAEECDRIVAAAETLPNAQDGSYIPMMKVHKTHPLFGDVISHPKVIENMYRLVHGEPCGLHTQMFFTPPQRAGLGTDQDNYFVGTQADAFASAWVPLVDITPENGGLYTYEDSHKGGALPVRKINAEDADKCHAIYEETILQEPYEKREIFVKKGTVVFLHGYNVHRSHKNRSDGKRYVILNTDIREGEDFRPSRTARREQFELKMVS